MKPLIWQWNLILLYVVYTQVRQDNNRLVKYVEFMPLVWDIGECIFTVIFGLLNKMHLYCHKLRTMTMDGIASMTREWHGLVVWLRENVYQLMGVHCTPHQEDLTMQNANKYIMGLNFLDQTSYKVYRWLDQSSIWRRIKLGIIGNILWRCSNYFQIHNAWWLSRERVMNHLVYYMPTILKAWKIDEPTWYHNVTTF